ncbi:CpsD/CapB family tyrosine-protein kinase [Bombilactobacillus thymidiniphilus]|uniref:Tyrosine-protein kinase CpsD n=1 Tax=Bombilactobacillus thymidiniphilus TaxID=2923363 RepID=A0ABY4PC96_9LACO|nr:CpsD/CapB family tyrosine-protein kinase [Bombilactobacillus thymidiniphilus]UQS83288.1 CpsD/CapB family tyrosine-protein kinase [Bombilactobacillus thymidiniphilus]
MFNRKKNKTKFATRPQPVSLISLLDSRSNITEQYRTIRTNVQFASSSDHPIKSIVVTSAGPSEGKSTTAANLAVVFAKSGQKVLLVDADMRKPTVWRSFKLNNEQGLSTLLVSANDVTQAIQKTVIEELDILTSGPKPPNPSELLGSKRKDEVLLQLNYLYDIIIMDMPPVVTVTDAQIMASKADGTILVTRENMSDKTDLIKAKELLDIAHARILGVVYNCVANTKERNDYYGAFAK